MNYRKRLIFIIILLIAAMPSAVAADGFNLDPEVIGMVPRLLTATSDRNAKVMECALGDAAADAARIYLKSDLAIICGGDFAENLMHGSITRRELESVFTEDRTLATANITIKKLRQILEVGISRIILDEALMTDVEASIYEGFPQISGFVMYYDPTALPGERVYEIRIDSEAIDLDSEEFTVQLAATAFMFEGGYGLPEVDEFTSSDLTLTDVMSLYIKDGMADYTQTGQRMKIMGTMDGTLANKLPSALVIMVVVMIMLARAATSKKNSREFNADK